MLYILFSSIFSVVICVVAELVLGAMCFKHRFRISLGFVCRMLIACADPDIFMRGGPTKMVIFGYRLGGVQPPKNPKITFFLGKIFKFQGGSGPPVPPLDPRMYWVA